MCEQRSNDSIRSEYMFWTVLLGIVCVSIGIFFIWKPDTYWKLTERWKAYGSAEPSDFYIKATRLGGGAFIVCGVIVAVLPLILK